MDEEQSESLLAPTPEFLASVKVFPLIPNIKRDVEKDIDTALSWEQLTASDINFAIVRPLVFKYARLDNMSTVYACFVVRSHFLSEAEQGLAYSGVMLSRASLCEILAIKLLGTFASSRIRLVAVLTASWSSLAGAPPDITQEVRGLIGDDEQYDPQCALEMAIATEAKAFLASPVVQTIVNDIYAGRVVFSMSSNHSVLADNYKPRAIEIYDGRKAPFLDHYRLRVPRYGAILEFLNFALLLTTFLLCLSNQQVERLTAFEFVFIIFATAFTLEEYTASKEHGWGIYIANMWNVFDTSFVVVFLTYLGFRIKGLVHHDANASEMGFDILACGACILFPRLAFFAVSNNVVVLALRAMIAEFIFFVGIAAICFSGLLFTLHSLAADTWSVKAIAWLMVQIWFGNTYLSFGQAKSFHPIFGPILMTGFAALSNTLLLTIKYFRTNRCKCQARVPLSICDIYDRRSQIRCTLQLSTAIQSLSVHHTLATQLCVIAALTSFGKRLPDQTYLVPDVDRHLALRAIPCSGPMARQQPRCSQQPVQSPHAQDEEPASLRSLRHSFHRYIRCHL